MKRAHGLTEKLCSFENLYLAAKKASKGKKKRSSTARFLADLEIELLRLKRELSSGTWQPGEYGRFVIRDPKERTISVAPFRDRVVHHAVINVMEPFLEARFDFDSYGCRKGKGMDKALERTMLFCRRYPCCLKMDIQKFFASIDQERLMLLIRVKFKDKGLLLVTDRIIKSTEKGLPLGNLTSQWFANFYLTPFDRFLRKQPESEGIIRYMDDMLVFGKEKQMLRMLLSRIRRFLGVELLLGLKERMTHIHETAGGIPYLGFRVLKDRLLLRRETWKRYMMRLKRREWEYGMGWISASDLAASVSSMTAHVRRASTRGLRQRFFEERKAAEW